MPFDQEDPQLDNKQINFFDINQTLSEIKNPAIKDAITLLDHGAVKCGDRFQAIDKGKFIRWMKKDISIDKLTASIERWEIEEKKIFGKEEERYERESVYVNFMFRLDILTRMAKKDGIQMAEIFDSLRQFVLEQSQIFENLLDSNQAKKSINQDGIYSYDNNADDVLQENKLTILWKQYVISKKYLWPDVIIAESAKILKLLPKAIESFNRLGQKSSLNVNNIVKEIFVPKKAL